MVTSGGGGGVPIVAVIGPTASGKSELGLQLATELGGEIINADASQFYRGMDIGTAKVPLAQRRGVAHHQIDVLDLGEEARVAAYQRAGRHDLAAVRTRGARPIVVGGSGLYVRALLDRLDIPPTDASVRARWEELLSQRGSEEVHAELARQDPAAAARIDARNERRVVRALEVIELTGRPFSASMPRREYSEPTVMIGLLADRSVLNARIAARVESMWSGGLLNEVRTLEAHGLRHSPTALRALGYAQALAHLDGQLSATQAQDDTAIATRKYARRQMAWFRADPRIIWLPHDDSRLTQRALQEIRTN